MNNETEINTTPPTDGAFVETAFGRSDFHQVEENRAKRKYVDTASAKANGLNSRQIRSWAKERGLVTSTRGKMPKSVIALFKQENFN